MFTKYLIVGALVLLGLSSCSNQPKLELNVGFPIGKKISTFYKANWSENGIPKSGGPVEAEVLLTKGIFESHIPSMNHNSLFYIQEWQDNKFIGKGSRMTDDYLYYCTVSTDAVTCDFRRNDLMNYEATHVWQRK